MKSPAERLALLPRDDQKAFISSLSEDDAAALLYDWRGFLARPNQIEPEGNWDIWLLLAGRGFGKTRTGAEWIKEQVATGKYGRIALVAETNDDLRGVMIEGDSGILQCYPKSERPVWTKTTKELVWPNGAIALGFSAQEPSQLRGPQHDLAWSDEICKWRYARETWDQLQFGLRLGPNPRQLVSTTPRPIEVLKDIIAGKEGVVHTTRGNTDDNKSNLSAKFIRKIYNKYAGTRLGRQELSAEILGDMPGALWSLGSIDVYRIDQSQLPETFDRILVAVDPAVTNTDTSNEHGIVVVACKGDKGYVLEDGSMPGTPNQWANRALSLHDKWEADGIVGEVNNGGDMVENTVRSIRKNIVFIQVRATRGKHVRAEPVASLYEQGRVSHLGSFIELENQMILMTNAGWMGESGSPDRLDAMVWGLTCLFPSITRKIETVELVKPRPQASPYRSQRKRGRL